MRVLLALAGTGALIGLALLAVHVTRAVRWMLEDD